MVKFGKSKSHSSVKGQLKGLLQDIGIETLSGLKETGKEIVRGVTQQNWEKEWLGERDKNKPPLSDKTGRHTPINPEAQFAKQEQRDLRLVQQKLSQMYTHASSQSEYGQQKVKESQEQTRPVYDKNWQEKEERQRQQAAVAKPTTVDLGATGSKRPAGDWRRGAKVKRRPTPQELNRVEFAGSRGKQ